MSAEVGSVALNGDYEYIRGHIFDAVEYDRYIIGRGTWIMIIPPPEEGETKLHRDVETETKIHVPPKHEVKVVDALVKMTT